MTEYKTIGLYWIDNNGYYHYPNEDQFEFGKMDGKTNGEFSKLESKIESCNVIAQNEYNAGYDAGWKANSANAKAGLITAGMLLGTVTVITAATLYAAYRTEKLNTKKKD